jgi:trehalose utilization protein
MSPKRPIRVLVWDEQQPEQRAVYPEFLGHAIADHLARQPGIAVRCAALDDPEQGLDPRVLDETDVLIWWGHRRHDAVEDERVVDVVNRISRGCLGLLALHSSHWSLPFVRAMEVRSVEKAMRAACAQSRPFQRAVEKSQTLGEAFCHIDVSRPRRFQAPNLGDSPTHLWRLDLREARWVLFVRSPNCGFPKWRREGGPSRITTLLPESLIAQGIPRTFTLRETEMYSEPFHVPEPDAVIFEERWETGEHFRTGMTWQVGEGRVFYFGPGHETYDVFRQEIPLRIVTNAVRWLGAPNLGAPPSSCGNPTDAHSA